MKMLLGAGLMMMGALIILLGALGTDFAGPDILWLLFAGVAALVGWALFYPDFKKLNKAINGMSWERLMHASWAIIGMNLLTVFFVIATFYLAIAGLWLVQTGAEYVVCHQNVASQPHSFCGSNGVATSVPIADNRFSCLFTTYGVCTFTEPSCFNETIQRDFITWSEVKAYAELHPQYALVRCSQ